LKYAPKNQLEAYLDEVFGGDHKAHIDHEDHSFVITKDGNPVEDFRIIYLCGKRGRPNHTGLVTSLPEVLHVNLDEIVRKLF
jgi:hypothetical protein